MPSRAEIAFREVVRGLEGQAQDLAAIRAHVSLALSAGALSAAFIGGVTDDHGIFFWLAVAAFVYLALATIWVYRPVHSSTASTVMSSSRRMSTPGTRGARTS
jgi:membrane protein implicated in regulation of membrane protease activity